MTHTDPITLPPLMNRSRARIWVRIGMLADFVTPQSTALNRAVATDATRH